MLDSLSTATAPRRLKVLIVGDVDREAPTLKAELLATDHVVTQADCLGEAKRLLLDHLADIVLIRWEHALGGLLDELRAIDPTRSVPVIVLEGRCSDADRVAVLEAGADGLVANPVSNEEVIARVRSLSRRCIEPPSSSILTGGDIELDCDLLTVRRRGRLLHVSRLEMRILEFFLRAPRQTHSRQAVLDAVWGGDNNLGARTVDVHVGRLRKRLKVGRCACPVRTIKGAGYRFDPQP